MKGLDLSNIDWVAMLKSQVVLGSVVTFVTSAMALGGHSIPPDQQTDLTQLVSQILSGLAALAGAYTFFHRVTAQAEQQSIIIPKKAADDTAQTPKS